MSLEARFSVLSVDNRHVCELRVLVLYRLEALLITLLFIVRFGEVGTYSGWRLMFQ